MEKQPISSPGDTEKAAPGAEEMSAKQAEPLVTRTWKKLILPLILVIVFFILAVFLGTSLKNELLIREVTSIKARTLIESVVLARSWNASYGGVFVEKKEGVRSNPYLRQYDITAVDGRVYTKKNPALMTREISKLAKKSKFFQFNITSLKPLNPNNKPDKFERSALLSFEQGKKTAETTQEGPEPEQYRYRYMVPLYTEKGCLQCHEEQGYKLGDIRGGISVDFDITGVKRGMIRERSMIWLLGAAAVINFLAIIFLLARMSRRSPD